MKNLKTLRKQHNLSQQGLADILHISQQSVYKYENDITAPDLETLKIMADYFNTSVDYIIGYSDFPEKNERRFETSVNIQELELLKQYRAIPASQKEIIQVLIAEFLKNRT